MYKISVNFVIRLLIFILMVSTSHLFQKSIFCIYSRVSVALFDIQFNLRCMNKDLSITNLSDLKINKQYSYPSVWICNKNFRNFTEPIFVNQSVSELVLNFDKISFISNQTFSKILNLKYLNLDNNELSIIWFVELNLNSINPGLKLQVRSNQLEQLNKINYDSTLSVNGLDLFGNLIGNIDECAFDNLLNLTILDLSSNLIEFISNVTFAQLTKITVINLQSNIIRTIQAGTFSNLNSLKQLDMSSNEINQIEPNSLPASLSRLDLGFNQLEDVADVNLKDLPSLFELKVQSNSFVEFRFEYVANETNLFSLDISLNNIQLIDFSQVQTLKNLTQLDLSYSKLSRFVIDTNFMQSRIKRLSLRNNRLSNVSNQATNGLIVLEIFDLSFNLIHDLEANFFLNFNRLIELNMSNNLLKNLLANIFRGLFSLKKLTLSSNEIGSIYTDSFRGLISLEQLTLTNNKISFIEKGSFKDLNLITTIDLAFNKLEQVRAYQFDSLASIDTLNLSHNFIVSIEPGSFRSMFKLTRLDLSYNALVTLATGTFIDVTVQYLNLEANKITHMNADSFSTSSFISCNLARNKIHNRELFYQIANYVQDLSLAENGFVEFIIGESDLIDTFNFLMKTLDVSSNLIKVFRFETDKFKLLNSIDLSNNLIEHLNISDFSYLYKLRSLYLSNNNLKYIDSGFFKYHKYQVLVLRNCLNRVYTNIDLNQFSTRIKTLDISNNKFERIILTNKLSFLDELYLSNNSLDDSNEFINSTLIKNLLTIDLSYNNLRFYLNVFNTFKNLTHFNLKAVNLSSLDSITFAPQIVRLDLSSNSIKVIRAEDLSSLLNLNWLNLSQNQIESIESDSFVTLSLLEILDLSFNKLKNFYFLLSPSCLSYLNIKSNQIYTYYKGRDEFIRLKQLDFSYNELEALDFESLFMIESIVLEKLILGYNLISVIGTEPFQQMISLLVLDLKCNRLGHIDDGAFLNLKNIQWLDLSLNNLTLDRNKLLFSSLFQLSYLNLSHNRIEYLYGVQFTNLYNLLELDVSYNRLKSIEAYAFEDLNKLVYVDLSHNGEISLAENSLSGLDSIKDIYISLDQLITNHSNGSLNANSESLINSLKNLDEVKHANEIIYYRSIYINYHEYDIDCLMTLKFIKFNLQLKLKSDYEFSLFLTQCYSINLENLLD